MPRQMIVEAYTIEELRDDVRRKVVERFRDKYAEDIFAGIIEEQISYRFCEELHKSGFPTEDIHWSLRYNQGDGMAFYGRIDLNAFVGDDKQFDVLRDSEESGGWCVEYMIVKNWATHYSHYTMTVEVEDLRPLSEEENEAAIKLGHVLEKAVKDMSHELEAAGYDIIEPHYEYDYIFDFLSDNECLYEESGYALTVHSPGFFPLDDFRANVRKLLSELKTSDLVGIGKIRELVGALEKAKSAEIESQ